ncbi:MAG: hypothetical protein AAFQ41_14185 [Cyanobacteria bacterium J06623_7]
MNLKLNPIVICFLAVGLLACGNRQQLNSSTPKKEVVRSVLAESNSPVKTQLEYDDVVTIKDSEYVVIPVGYRVRADKRIIYSDADQVYRASKSDIWQGTLAAVNLVFHGHQSDRTHLLLDRNAFVAEFDYLANSQPINSKIDRTTTVSSCQPPKGTPLDHRFTRLMLYQIVKQDTDQDGVLDFGDANQGYISDLSGQNLQVITPDLTKLKGWHCDYQREKLLLFVQESTKKTSSKEIDPLVLYTYSLNGNKLKRITPPQSHLENWQIELKDGSMYLFSRLDANGDRQYNAADETRVIKYSLETETAVEINDPQIRQLLSQ